MTIHPTTAFRAVKPITLLALAALILVVALFVGAQGAAAQVGPGNFCIQDYRAGAVCTANDVVLAALSPDITQACTAVGDTAIVSFQATFHPSASTRYDIGMFIDTNGTSALSGDSCYHDFLKPATTPPVTGPVNLTSGAGPFRNEDADVCADIIENDGDIHYDMAEIEVTCVDANNDGVVDPISTCTSWDNNAGTTCSDVSQAFPGTNSKCNCSTAVPNPPILIYRGYDFGDLPEGIITTSTCNPPVTYSYGTTLAQNGARHAIQDFNGDGILEAQGGEPAIWLGDPGQGEPSAVDYSNAPLPLPGLGETDGQPGVNADGDDTHYLRDENGFAPSRTWYVGPNGAQVIVEVRATAGGCSVASPCNVVWWMDWDGNGQFDNTDFQCTSPTCTTYTGERYVRTVTGGPDNYTYTFDAPYIATWGSCDGLYTRVRLYSDAYTASQFDPKGLVVNGEVEDYKYLATPQAVTLASFAATCQTETPVITWETVSEVDTAGFNVWRSDTAGAPETRLNASMIPAHPGSTQGYSYSWTDSTAEVGQVYHYWLEDVDINGATGLNGPVEAICTGPTAVTVSDLQAKGSADSTTVWWAPLIALIAGIGLAILLSRRAKTA